MKTSNNRSSEPIVRKECVGHLHMFLRSLRSFIERTLLSSTVQKRTLKVSLTIRQMVFLTAKSQIIQILWENNFDKNYSSVTRTMPKGGPSMLKKYSFFFLKVTSGPFGEQNSGNVAPSQKTLADDSCLSSTFACIQEFCYSVGLEPTYSCFTPVLSSFLRCFW